MSDHGKFVISLDFELQWGVRDIDGAKQYQKNIIGVHTAFPRLLQIFEEYNIKATFAIVGFLFAENKSELLDSLPASMPDYENKNLSPYNGYFSTVGNNYNEDPLHFAPHLIEMLKKSSTHEIGTHTFSHYYCLEKGQTLESFEDDLILAKRSSQKHNINITSLVFPRNQFNKDYIKVCEKHGIICYRGNEHSGLYTARNKNSESKVRRALRLVDAYFNISGYNCYTDSYLRSSFPVDIPASRFLRPYSRALSFFDKLKLRRITNAMSYAARHNLTYHLWWHPHNFGINQDENFAFLEKILSHYKALNRQYSFESITMSKLALQMLGKNKTHEQNSKPGH
jgi:peptidoglycan/xylan/chitin deacetylase (PgdA/CDA1 family)